MWVASDKNLIFGLYNHKPLRNIEAGCWYSDKRYL